MMRNSLSRLGNFAHDQCGSMTAFGLYIFVAGLMLTGLAVDYGNLVQSKARQQVNVDSVAHTALVQREFNTPAVATQMALAIDEANMPASKFGDLINSADVEFGSWDPATRSFTVDPNSRQALRVTAHQTSSYGNSIPTFLLKLVGTDSWDLATQAIYTTYNPACLTEGFVAEDVVNISSNDSYFNDFCIHSQNYVSLSSNNYFEAGTSVSMPDLSKLVLPASGYTTNIGLQDALSASSYNIRILPLLPKIIAALGASNVDYLPTYVTSATPVALSTKKALAQSDLSEGHIYTADCSTGNGTLTISNSVILSKVAIVTNCNVKFGNGSVMQDAVIATTSTDSKSFTGTSGIQIGKNDNCATGGGAQLLTLGGVSFPAALSVYGGQIVAEKDITFSANANGIQGASFISGGQITGTSNMNMGNCNSGMEENFSAEYFRLVQ
ncbi:hypothetical protein GC209_17160 [bacterium]|nr:hypothetical protein [bacterium]